MPWNSCPRSPGTTAHDHWNTHSGSLHLKAGLHCRPRPRRPAVPRLRTEPGDRGHCVLKLDLDRHRRRTPERPWSARARRAPRPHLAADLGAHRLLGRLPLGLRRGHHRTPPAPQPGPRQDGRITRVPDTLTLCVVYLTTDALPSTTLSRTVCWSLAALLTDCLGSAPPTWPGHYASSLLCSEVQLPCPDGSWIPGTPA